MTHPAGCVNDRGHAQLQILVRRERLAVVWWALESVVTCDKRNEHPAGVSSSTGGPRLGYGRRNCSALTPSRPGQTYRSARPLARQNRSRLVLQRTFRRGLRI